ncbi:LacI family DNA-binding transcriptional regulator [Pararhizobium mangrovi]|uniref:LacI family DNA-binding transcriptional regulator n=1 Tax=Pararhizobium mangrovi TaxID=2590452 RepID=A0A506U4U0_9HYPH|nr:LacI family DNA-binding transcriptional regulator [Pararhizobium mangrovi]TPW28366.1 LacI family DNA-binding transcriptional regulator [Pararhizobium mangrovi]
MDSSDVEEGSPAVVPGRNRRRMQSVRMVDVARLADVSPSTVSLYLRRPSSVAPHTGSTIERAIKELGYVPNMVAGGLAAAGSRVVSIIVPSLRNAFFAETVSAMEALLARQGFHILIGHTEYSLEREEELVRAALSWAPAAIVLTGLNHADTTRTMLAANRTPVVEMWETGDASIDINVGFSHAEVGGMAARHLISRGRTRLAFLGARLEEDTRAAQRCEGFRSACVEAGIEPQVVRHSAPASTEAGGILLARALAQGAYDGFACSNDTVALGVVFEAQRRGIRIPRTFSLIGFGDLEFGSFCDPSLTTIRPSADLIAKNVTELVLARINGEPDIEKGYRVEVGASIIVRGSS